MSRSFRRRQLGFVLCLSIPMGWTPQAPAQIVLPDPGGDNFISQETDPLDREPPPKPKRIRRAREITPEVTEVIVQEIEQAVKTCDNAPDYYKIDCISLTFQRLSGNLPRRGEYADVREALDQAADELARVVRENRDRTSAVVRLDEPEAAQPLRRPLRPVLPEADAVVSAAAEAVIDETVTILLRSAENIERREAHYQRIAQAVDSTKFLLRS